MKKRFIAFIRIQQHLLNLTIDIFEEKPRDFVTGS